MHSVRKLVTAVTLVVTCTVPVLLTIPNSHPRPVAGWPVVIFVHGITGRGDRPFGGE